MSILDTLRDKKIITADDIPVIEHEAKESGLSLEQVLVSRGITPEKILDAKGLDLGIPTRSLKGVNIPGKILDYIPEESADHYKIAPIATKDGVLEVGIVDPDDIEARD